MSPNQIRYYEYIRGYIKEFEFKMSFLSTKSLNRNLDRKRVLDTNLIYALKQEGYT